MQRGLRREQKQVGESQLGQVSFVLDASSSKASEEGGAVSKVPVRNDEDEECKEKKM